MKVLTIRQGELIGNLYLNKEGGYYYRIYFKKIVKGQLLAQSYVYLYSKDQCIEKMRLEMKTLLNINKDLLDFEKLEK